MIRSMTGFGEARREDNGYSYHVEIRSVNNRYLKTAVYLPEEFNALEPDLERHLRENLVRGSVTVRLHVRSDDPAMALAINQPILRAYLDQLREAAGQAPGITIDAASLLVMPGVSQASDVSEQERQARAGHVLKLVDEALARLIEMRQIEGESLCADLRRHCTCIRRSLDIVRTRTPEVLREYRDRLMTRIQELIADSSIQLAADDLLKEVSIYAERSDISEELARLDGHLDQFDALLAASETSGRKLEFVAQELLREANTIGSKTGDAQIAREIVEVKSAIDRIKEQVQNVE